MNRVACSSTFGPKQQARKTPKAPHPVESAQHARTVGKMFVRHSGFSAAQVPFPHACCPKVNKLVAPIIDHDVRFLPRAITDADRHGHRSPRIGASGPSNRVKNEGASHVQEYGCPAALSVAVLPGAALAAGISGAATADTIRLRMHSYYGTVNRRSGAKAAGHSQGAVRRRWSIQFFRGGELVATGSS